MPSRDRRLIAGVDFGTRAIHLVRRREGTVEAEWRRYALDSQAKNANPDALSARAAGQAMLENPEWWDDVYLAGVEYTYAWSMGTVSNKTILGAICATIPEHVHVMPLPPDLWQKMFITRPGQEPVKLPRKSAERKPLIKARALELLDRDDQRGWPQDVWDAFGISWAAEQMNQAALDPLPRSKVAQA